MEGEIELRYCHFSVWLSKARKYRLCVAWNIDGNQFKRLKRVGFRTDRRADLEKYQLTDAIYVHNPFDKEHIARRADLCWGTPEESHQANYESFYYTNIAPQHEAFNQSDNTDDDPEGGAWGRLENTVLDSETLMICESRHLAALCLAVRTEALFKTMRSVLCLRNSGRLSSTRTIRMTRRRLMPFSLHRSTS